MKNKEIILLDLFSGIGGFSLGLIQAGFKIKQHYFSEIDKHAIANYQYNFKKANYVGSVTDVLKGAKLKPNIITFGSPCQDFSVAGKRKGLEGSRSSLIKQAIEIIIKEKPDFFIWENVKGAFSSNSGADFWAIIQAFTNIGGYRLEWQLLNTSWVLPQNRERIYLIGHLATSKRNFKPVFPFTENDRLFNKKKTTGPGQFQTKYNSTTIGTKQGNRANSTYIQLPKKVKTITGGGKSGGLHSDMTTINSVCFSKHQQDRVYNPKSIMTCLPSNRTEDKIKIFVNSSKKIDIIENGDSINLTFPKSKTRRGRIAHKKTNTLDCKSDQDVLINSEIRKLTEIECERLQGFPDNWTLNGMYNNKIKTIAKTNRYKLIGNAVTVKIFKLLSEKLIDQY